MLFSESRLLCSPEYLTLLIERSKHVSDKDLTSASARIEASNIPVTKNLSVDKNDNAHVYIYGPIVSQPDPFLVFFGESFVTYQDIQDSIEEIQKRPEIKKAYLHFDSPGGVVGDVDNTWKTIMDLRENVEVVAINEGEISSGAYWLASAANKIVATSETHKQGSIGVAGGYYKPSEDVKIITSKSAKYKRPNRDPEGYEEKIQKNLNSIEDIFIDRIAQGRGLTTDSIRATFGEGSILLSKEAKEVGMIDAIVPASQLFLSDTDKPVTEDLNTVKGDNVDMTLEEMLQNPGVQAEIAKHEAAAKESGRKGALAQIKTNMVYLGSDKYPQSVKDCALAVCEGTTPQAALDTLASHVDQELAAAIAAAAEADKDNLVPTPSVEPDVGTEEIKERSVADRVKAVHTLEGKV